jgi:hypothetical protein
MALPRLIGVGGLKRSGKDTVAEHWASTSGYVVMGMSDALLEMALLLDPIIGADRDAETYRLSEIVNNVGYVKAKEDPEVRRFLKVLGTEVVRDTIDKEYWIKRAEQTIREHWENGKNVVVTGIRFPNEVALIKRLRGELVWVLRPNIEDTSDAHASETSVSAKDFTYKIMNRTTLDYLYGLADQVMDRLNSQSVAAKRTDWDKESGEFGEHSRSSVSDQDVAEAKKTLGSYRLNYEEQRGITLATQYGWLAEVGSDGKVTTRHPLDFPTARIPGYTPLTRDPYAPVECELCGARYVNAIQHTRWHSEMRNL